VFALLAMLEQHLHADADPRKGLDRVASITASRAPLAASWRMQSGIAP
jgi:hypothetical protein